MSIINLCTVSDDSFIYKGLTLYESLKARSSNFLLHYLCIDDSTYDRLKDRQNESLKLYKVSDLINKDQALKALKEQEYRYFCWSLASYFSNYLLELGLESITYIDSDIFFHKDIQIILDAVGEKEIGVFRHRQFQMEISRNEGWFNVGVVHFKNKEVGRQVLKWWANSVLNKLHPELATCGDQRYLDAFRLDSNVAKVCFFDGEIGHGAPWHWQIYNLDDYANSGKISWLGKQQDLIFTHFSQFVHNFKEDSYIPSTQHHCYTPLSQYSSDKNLKLIYDSYFDCLKQTYTKWR
jgi:hypothetical protein